VSTLTLPAEHVHHTRNVIPAVPTASVLCEGYAGVSYLTRSGLAAELLNGFDDLPPGRSPQLDGLWRVGHHSY
jgi:hypothetical protein